MKLKIINNKYINNNMNEKTEKIFGKCLKLISRGYSIQYCLKKYSRYKDTLEEYFKTIKYLENLKNIKPKDINIKSSLNKIYSSAKNSAEPDMGKTKSKTAAPGSGRRVSLLKPAIVFITVLVVTIFSFAGTVYASQDSLPGENLYPVKRTAESIQLFFYPESKKGQLHFKLLNNRIYEADMLMESGQDSGIELIEELLLEIDEEYYQCKKYNFFEAGDEEETVTTINNIKNKYRNKYGQHNQDTEEHSGYNEDTGNKENMSNKENMGENERNQNRKGNGK